MNYIQSSKGGGLLGCISGLKFEPKFDMGHYVERDGSIIPTVLDVSFQFTPLHEEVLGFAEEQDRTFVSEGYPYSAEDISGIFGDD